MEFGKIRDFAKIDFKLPPTDEITIAHQQKIQKSDQHPKIFVGTPAWGCKKWVGKIYPLKTQPRDFLSHYVKQFSTIELNTTFYQIPDLETIERWKKAAPSDFVYCPKVFKGISHHPRFALDNDSRHLITHFIDTFSKLENKLGLPFLQLPPEADLQSSAVSLKKFIEFLPRDLPLAVEFRHPTWFENEGPFVRLRHKLFDFLAEKNISTVVTDVAGRRDVLHTSLPTTSVFIRFVGNSLDQSDYTRIDQWIPRLEEWMNLGIQKIYFITHEPDDVLAPELADYFIKRINQSSEAVRLKPLQFVQTEKPASLFS